MGQSSLQRSRPLGSASTAGRYVAWLLRLAFSLVMTVALLGAAGASPATGEGQGERGERGEFGEFGELGEFATELVTNSGQDGESAEYDAAYTSASRRTHLGGGPRERQLERSHVPRALAPTVYPRTLQRPRLLRRTAPADDDDHTQG